MRQGRKAAPDAGESQLLQNFLKWLDARKTGGMLIDLRLVKYGAARVTVDRAMGVDEEDRPDENNGLRPL